MKNKKGFTLVEIIICVLLIVLIGTISIALIVKNKKTPEMIEKEKFENIELVSHVYLESNEYYQKVLEQEGEMFFKFNELVDNGLIDEKNYNEYHNKCFKIYYDDYSTKNLILKEADDTEKIKCDKKINLKTPPELIVNLNDPSYSNTLCYNNPDELKLEVKIIPHENNIDNFIIKYKENDEEKEEPVEISDLTNNGSDFTYSFEIKEGYSDVQAILKTDYSRITENKSKIFLEGSKFKKDKYSSTNKNIITLSNNIITKKNNTNNISSISTNLNGVNNIDDINDNITNIKEINITDNCGHNYSYNINKVYNYNNNKIFFAISETNYYSYCYSFKQKHRFYYIFKDGSFLYSKSTCSGTTLSIYNPFTRVSTEITSFSQRNITGIKVKNYDDNKYDIYIELDYVVSGSSTRIENFYIYKYILNTNSISKKLDISKKLIGTPNYGSPNFCGINYEFIFYEPSSKKVSGSFDDYGVSFSCCDATNCLYSSYISEDILDKKSSKFKDYKKEYKDLKQSPNAYNKEINTTDIELMEKLDVDNIYNYVDSEDFIVKNNTYSSDFLGILKQQQFEKDNIIVIPYACQLERGEPETACFIELEKSLELTLSTSS